MFMMPAVAAPQALSYGTPTFDIFSNYQKKKTNRTVFHDEKGVIGREHNEGGKRME
jgi:hypothetical protein